AILRLVGATGIEAGAQLILGAVLGLGTLALLVLGVGLAGIMSLPVVWGGSLLLALGSAALTRRTIAEAAKQVYAWLDSAAPPSWFSLGCLSLLALFYATSLLFGLAPELAADALQSHLALAKI